MYVCVSIYLSIYLSIYIYLSNKAVSPKMGVAKKRHMTSHSHRQARCKRRNTVIENERKDAIRTISFPEIKPIQDIKNTVVQNFNLRNEIVREK